MAPAKHITSTRSIYDQAERPVVTRAILSGLGLAEMGLPRKVMNTRTKSAPYSVREEHVSSVRNFLVRVVSLRAEWADEDEEEPGECELWFRGEPDADAEHPLRPGRYRAKSMDDEEQEDELRYAFAQRGIQFSGSYRPITDWEWYFLMQHYGAPTRLLDWTEGALLGLYFALRSNDGTTDAAVWVLDAWWLNRHAIRSRLKSIQRRLGRYYKWALDHLPDPTDRKTKWILDYLPEAYSARPLPRLPAALRPPHIDRRIAVQLSAFTVHGSHPDGLVEVAARDRHARLVRLRIPKRRAKMIWDELDLFGVSETTVFPDLEGLARELKNTYAGTPIAGPPAARNRRK
jgi:hypothetical protein